MPNSRAALLLFLALSACPSGQEPADGGNPPACAAPTGEPISHQVAITADETWAATSVHQITADLTVSAGKTVTIEPCAQVVIKPGVFFYVDGKVVARGDATHPISITGDAANRFDAIFVRAPGSIELAYVTIEGGGANTGIAWSSPLLVEGAWPIVTPIFVDHVTVKDA